MRTRLTVAALAAAIALAPAAAHADSPAATPAPHHITASAFDDTPTSDPGMGPAPSHHTFTTMVPGPSRHHITATTMGASTSTTTSPAATTESTDQDSDRAALWAFVAGIALLVAAGAGYFLRKRSGDADRRH